MPQTDEDGMMRVSVPVMAVASRVTEVDGPLEEDLSETVIVTTSESVEGLQANSD